MEELEQWLDEHHIDSQAIADGHLESLVDDIKEGFTSLMKSTKGVRRSMQAVHIRVRHPADTKVLVYRTSGR